MRIHLSELLRNAIPLVFLCLAACSDGSKTPAATYSVGGTLTGLAAGNSIILTNNDSDRLTLSADGAFIFPAKLANATPYKLTLWATTPLAQPCTLTDGAGSINAANVTAVKVTCGVGSSKNVEVAGHVQFVEGVVQQTSLAGQTLELHKGDAVNEGDMLSSNQNSSAGIKMRDGGIITMRSDTQFKIDGYKFDGKQDGSEQSFFSLFKGGFRSVTGLIGKLHKKNYRIVTPNAAIGIRGTDHETYLVIAGSAAAKLSPVGTYDKVNSGETTLTNDKGSISILPKQMGFVAAPDQKPLLQPVDPHLFADVKPAVKTENSFDGRWSVKLVCDDVKDKGDIVKGYTWIFDANIKDGKLEGQYGQAGSPGSATFLGRVQSDGTVDIAAQGNTDNPEYTVGRVAKGTSYAYRMHGNLSESTGHATRTELRPCSATFAKYGKPSQLSSEFDGRWSVKLVCDDFKDKGNIVKGYTWSFDAKIENGELQAQYGQAGSPGSATFLGQLQSDGTVDISAHGNTGKPDHTVGRVVSGTPYSYQMQGKFSGSTGHAIRTETRPCEASFSRHL